MFTQKWIDYFLGMAKYVATASKDPSTKVGAVAVNNARAIVETGYNGLPRGVRDLPERMERPEKYTWTAHAEENLVAHAARQRLEGTTVFVTHMCCANCTRMLINAGVAKIVVSKGKTVMPVDEASYAMLTEAGVELRLYIED